jgi:hypothetical protein
MVTWKQLHFLGKQNERFHNLTNKKQQIRRTITSYEQQVATHVQVLHVKRLVLLDAEPRQGLDECLDITLANQTSSSQ